MIGLLSGKDVSGVPVLPGHDSYVVPRPSGVSADGTYDVLVMYQAIATLTIHPK
jgi:hypothetical protein